MDFTAPQIVTIIVALIGAASGIMSYFKGRQKEKADVAEAITKAAGELIEDYKAQIAEVRAKLQCQEMKIDRAAKELDRERSLRRRLGERVHALEVERDEFLKGIMALCGQLRELGHEPVWEPKVPQE